MPSLPDLQRRFADLLVDPQRATAGTALFRGQESLTLDRLAIYRGNYRGNCASALAGAYPVVGKIVGADFFGDLSSAYVRTHPSASADLNRYGGGFPDFLAMCPAVADLLYLSDVARLEWLAHEAHFGADAVPFEPSSLARVPPESYGALRMHLAPACALIESPWPLGRLWEIHQDDFEGPFEVDLDGRPDRVLVHRPGWRVQVQSLAVGDWRFLESARLGVALGPALEAAVDADPEFDPSTALGRWINAQVIVSLE